MKKLKKLLEHVIIGCILVCYCLGAITAVVPKTEAIVVSLIWIPFCLIFIFLIIWLIVTKEERAEIRKKQKVQNEEIQKRRKQEYINRLREQQLAREQEQKEKERIQEQKREEKELDNLPVAASVDMVNDDNIYDAIRNVLTYVYHNNEQFRCEYCGCLYTKDETICSHCGAPR